MFESKNKVIIAVLMLLVFVGQMTTASALSCQMGTKDKNQPPMMAHSTHGMAEMVDENSKSSSSMSDCCAKNGKCSMSGCFSLSVLGLSMEASVKISFSSEPAVSPAQLFLSNIPSSLYRPPIFS